MRKSLIFTRNADNSFMDEHRVRSLAPAVFASSKAEHLTPRYQQFRTADVLPIMADYGLFPVQAAQVNTRKGSIEHSNHLIAFAKESDIGQELRQEIVLYNSHNGQGALRLFAGAYRFICSNGIVAGDGYDARVYHSANQLRGFEEMLRHTIESLPRMMEQIDKLRRITLDFEEVERLANDVVKLRWKEHNGATENGVYYNQRTLRSALTARRSEDELYDAFTVFNRLQENVLRGGVEVISISDKCPEGCYRKARPIASVKEHVRINRGIFDVFNSL